MVTMLSHRLKRGETILPYVVKEIWKRRDSWNGNFADIEKAEILQEFLRDDLLQYRNVEFKESYRNLFHPSSAGRCLRSQWLDRKGAGDEIESIDVEGEARKFRIFENGDHVHYRWMSTFKRLGILEGREIPFVAPEHRMCGKADGIVKVGKKRILFDIKGINPSTFGKMLKEGTVGVGYEAQIQTYLEANGIAVGAIIAENKANCDVAEFVIKRDPKVFAWVLGRKDSLFSCLETNDLPDREGVSPGTPPCVYCPYVPVCWIDSKVKSLAERLCAKEVNGNGVSEEECKRQSEKAFGRAGRRLRSGKLCA